MDEDEKAFFTQMIETLNNKMGDLLDTITATRDYPFCDTSKCPWWRGYCSRDPACND